MLTKKSFKWVRHNQVSWSILITFAPSAHFQSEIILQTFPYIFVTSVNTLHNNQTKVSAIYIYMGNDTAENKDFFFLHTLSVLNISGKYLFCQYKEFCCIGRVVFDLRITKHQKKTSCNIFHPVLTASPLAYRNMGMVFMTNHSFYHNKHFLKFQPKSSGFIFEYWY